MKRYFAILLVVLTLTAISTTAPAKTLCQRLHTISTGNRKALRQINDFTIQRPSKTYSRIYSHANAVMTANQWPFTFSQDEPNTYRFKPADFDGDGRTDKMASQCGAPSWNRMCLLTLDRAKGKDIDLESGWMYVTRLDGHFYVVVDHYGPEASQGPDKSKDFSLYYKITANAFSEICK